MPKIDVGKIWSLNYQLLMSVITCVAPGCRLNAAPGETARKAEFETVSATVKGWPPPFVTVTAESAV